MTLQHPVRKNDVGLLSSFEHLHRRVLLYRRLAHFFLNTLAPTLASPSAAEKPNSLVSSPSLSSSISRSWREKPSLSSSPSSVSESWFEFNALSRALSKAFSASSPDARVGIAVVASRASATRSKDFHMMMVTVRRIGGTAKSEFNKIRRRRS